MHSAQLCVVESVSPAAPHLQDCLGHLRRHIHVVVLALALGDAEAEAAPCTIRAQAWLQGRGVSSDGIGAGALGERLLCGPGAAAEQGEAARQSEAPGGGKPRKGCRRV